jgi:hypothetical protein
MTYYYRTLALAYLVGWMLFLICSIGTPPPSTGEFEWHDAWGIVGFMAIAMWLGWTARKEQEQKP